MIQRTALAASVFVFCLAGYAQGQALGEGDLSSSDEELRTLSLEQVPPVVMEAARRAAPDVFFTDAESYWRNDTREYHLRGRLFREKWDVYVSEDGKLLRTEADNQDS